MWTIRLAAILAAWLALPAVPEQQPAFRSGVQVLEVDARVFDAQGRFVTDLGLADFEILEDGRPQAIQTVFLVRTQPAAARQGAPAVAAVPDNPRHVPQTWIFVFDDVHMMPGGYRRAKTALDGFMTDRFRPGDFAGIVVNGRMLGNRISSERSDYLVALRTMTVPGESASRARDSADADVTGGDGEAGATIRDALRTMTAIERERAARTAVQTLDELARGLARVPGPKTVVVFSDGFALARLEELLRSTVGQLNRAGARVYAVDTRGLAGPPTDTMNSLAVDTGGLTLFNANNLSPVLDEIAADTNTYYVLGYQPSNPKMDGRYREIDVRVKRPGVTVRARRGYLALQPSQMTVPRAPR
jgi:VWFA-related protein